MVRNCEWCGHEREKDHKAVYVKTKDGSKLLWHLCDKCFLSLVNYGSQLEALGQQENMDQQEE